MRFWLTVCLLTVCPLCSQFETKLGPDTVKAYDAYLKTAETEQEARWSGKMPFISLAVPMDDQNRHLKADLVIRPTRGQSPDEIPDGLIHDWVGAIFIPNVNVNQVLTLLEDFDQHSKIYPEIIRSRLIGREGDDVSGYWRTERKQQFVPAVLDMKMEAHYHQVAPGKWVGQSRAIDIREVQDAGSVKEYDYPPDQGLGLLWRLEAFWSLQASGNGVLAECRTVSLSRGIPSGMGWIIKPFIQNVPRESLTSTLLNTRKTLTR